MSVDVLKTLLGKIGGLLLTLFLSSIVIFFALKLTPGDPVSSIAGGVRPTPEMAEIIREQYHLNDPIWVQYWSWITNVFSGNLGKSFVYKADVIDIIAPRFSVTFMLVSYALLLIAVFGLGSGILAATRGKRVDRFVLISTSIGMAMPTFVVAILLIWIFSITLGLFPVYGAGEGFLDNLYHLTLPAISLAVLFIAYVSRVSRSALVAQAHSEHVETARVRSIPRGKIFRSHIFLNASPQIMAITGATIAALFAVSAITDQAFGLGGMGSLLTQAASRKDIPVVQVVSLFLVCIFVVMNALADIVTAIIDPESLKSRRNQ
jgi:peptide/nickel transport system permease protein